MNPTPAETHRLAEAVAGLAATLTEIINARVRELSAANEPQVVAQTAAPSPSPSPAVAIEGWVAKKEVARHFNVSVRTVETWMSKGYLPYMRAGSKNVRFKLSELDSAMNQRLKVHGRW